MLGFLNWNSFLLVDAFIGVSLSHRFTWSWLEAISPSAGFDLADSECHVLGCLDDWGSSVWFLLSMISLLNSQRWTRSLDRSQMIYCIPAIVCAIFSQWGSLLYPNQTYHYFDLLVTPVDGECTSVVSKKNAYVSNLSGYHLLRMRRLAYIVDLRQIGRLPGGSWGNLGYVVVGLSGGVLKGN